MSPFLSPQSSPPGRARVIVNPASASGKTGRRWPALAPRVLQALPGAEVVHTQARGDGERLAREAARLGYERVVAVGGDGTIHEVINGLFDEAGAPINPLLTLSALPMGTGSDLCRSLGLPRDPEEALAHLAAPPREVDAGWVWFEEPAEGGARGRAFINIASFGLSGQVARHFEEHGKGGGLSYLMGIYTASQGYENAPLTLALTGASGESREVRRTVYTGAVANARYFGSGMPIAPDALLDDGLFQVVLVGDLSVAEVTRRLPALYRGTHLSRPKFDSFEASAVRVAPQRPGGRAVWVELDGEPEGTLPARFEVRPRALRVTAAPSAPALSAPALSAPALSARQS